MNDVIPLVVPRARNSSPEWPRPQGRGLPRVAMALAAGLGRRMRPLTATAPKPLIEVGGRALIDRVLDRLGAAGVEEAVVNVHYLADQMEGHLARRTGPRVVISDERARLLDSGGGLRHALPLLGDGPILVTNCDSFWIEGPTSNLARMAAAFDPARMDALLLLASTAVSVGYDGRGDFAMDAAGTLHRRPEREIAPFVYAGVALLARGLVEDLPEGASSLNLAFDRAAEAGRLAGLRLDGTWLHVGDPGAIREAEARLEAEGAPQARRA